jgi:type I restriction enzyme M protein
MRQIDVLVDVLRDENVEEAAARGIIQISEDRVTYNLKQKREYDWRNPDEWVRARTLAFLIIEKNYPASRIRTEVQVPRRTPSDWADIVVYQDDKCQRPYLVVENKAAGRSPVDRSQGIEQAFGNANSLRAPFVLYDEDIFSLVWDVANYASMEREANQLGPRAAVPDQYGQAPTYAYIAGGPRDIQPASSFQLEAKIRRAHSIIWSGGRRDPLRAFDEWSKLLFAKVIDERRARTRSPRQFQVGRNETTTAVANRIHRLFAQGCRDDPTVFPSGTRIDLPDKKVYDVVQTVQDLSFIRTDVDSIG